MPQAEGRKFEFKGKEAIRWDLLEPIPWQDKLPTLITFETKEFSAVCPFSGLPDIASLTVEFVPSDKILELKSWKYVVTSFRDVGIYQEEMTELVARELAAYLNPLYLKVSSTYNVRGGYLTTAEVELGDRETALGKGKENIGSAEEGLGIRKAARASRQERF